MKENRLKILSGAIVALVLAGVVLGLCVANARSARFAARRAEQVLTDSAREQVATLSAALYGQLSALHLMADAACSHTQDKAGALSELMKSAEENLSCGLVFMTDSSGKAISGSVAGGDFSDRAYVQAALAGNDGMEFIKIRNSDRPGVALSVPCGQAGNGGALCGIFFADTLTELLSSEAYGGEGFSYIMNTSAEVIAGGNDNYDLSRGENIMQSIHGAQASNKISARVEAFAASFAAREQAVLDYSDDEGRFMVVCIPFESDILPENDWLLVNVATGGELLPEIKAFRANSVEAMSVFGVCSLLALVLFLQLRRDVTRRLNQDNERMNRLISDMPGGFLRLELLPDGQGVPSYFNDNFCSLLGLTRQQILELDRTYFLDGIHPKDRAYVMAGVSKLLATGEPQHGRYRLMTGSGAYCWFTVYGGVSKSDSGSVFLNLYYTDATDLIEATERYRRVVSDRELCAENEIVSCHLNITQNLADGCLSPYQEILALAKTGTADGFISAVFNKIPAVEDQQAFFSCFSREALQSSFYSGKNHVQLEHRVLMGDDHIWVKSAADMLKNPETGDLEALICARDVDGAYKQRQLINMVVDADYDFVIVITVKTGLYKTYVKSGGTTTIFQNEGNYGETLASTAEHILPEDREAALKALQLSEICHRLRKFGHSEVSYRILDEGEVRNKKLAHVWLDDTHRDIIAFRSDVTLLLQEQERQKEQLSDALNIAEQANAAKTDFLSSMSHDIRTPMNAIVGMSELALEDLDDPAQVRESLQIIKDSSAHLLMLINDILDMSRIESGKMVLTHEAFSQGQLFSGMADMYRVIAEKKGLSFVTNVDVQNDGCVGDKQRIHRIVDNLVGNAIKFTPPGGTISMSMRELPAEKPGIGIYEFVVSDTGLGMSEQTQRRIYEPFYRSDSTRANNIEGSGLGLPIVKSIVDLIGGSIDVRSTKGIGTTFTVHLPLKLSERSAAELQATTDLFGDKDLGGMRILLCEDNEVNQLVAMRILEKLGAVVTIAENGQLGVDAFTSNPPGSFDVVLMDIQMPVLNGYEATAAIRASGREDSGTIPIFAMTADAFVEDVHKSFEAGMNAHLTKPIEPDKLFEALISIKPAAKTR